MSRFLVVPCSSLFPVQPHELFAHTVQTFLGKQLLISSWALLWLLQFTATVPKCFTNINALIFIPFTWTCINSILLIRNYDTGIEVKNIPVCIPGWRLGGLIFSTPRTIQHIGLSWSCTSSSLLPARLPCLARHPAVPILPAPPTSRLAEFTAFQGQRDSSTAGSENWGWAALTSYHLAMTSATSHNFWHSPKVAQLFFSMGHHCLP